MADNIPDKYGYLIIYCTESTRDEGIPLTVEGEQEDDEHLNEIEVNQSRFKLQVHRGSSG